MILSLKKGDKIDLSGVAAFVGIKLTDTDFCKEGFHSKIKVYGIENFSFSSIWFTTIFLEYRGEKYVIKNKHSHMFPSSVVVEKVNKFVPQSLNISGEKIFSMTCRILKESELFMTEYMEDEIFIRISYGNDFMMIYNKRESSIEQLKFGGETVQLETLILTLDNLNEKGELTNGC